MNIQALFARVGIRIDSVTRAEAATELAQQQVRFEIEKLVAEAVGKISLAASTAAER